MATMYNLKPTINHSITIERPLCMYEMKSFHDDGDSKQTCRIVSETPLAEVAALEVRQEKILGQLAELKEQVLNLSSDLNTKNNNNSNQKASSAETPRKQRASVCADLVLHVDPSRPCYSLLALEKLWNDVDFPISSFVQSTAKNNAPEGFKRASNNKNSSLINLTLIWKDASDPQLIISAVQNISVIGEINFLRYLARLLDDDTYEQPQFIAETLKIDRILDLSHQLVYEQSPKDKQAISIILSQLLGSNDWLSGKNQPGLSDVAVWSSIKQCSLKKLPSKNLTAWYSKCETFFFHRQKEQQ